MKNSTYESSFFFLTSEFNLVTLDRRRLIALHCSGGWMVGRVTSIAEV